MSLNTAQFKADLKEVYTATYQSTGSRDDALDAFIDAFADKVEAYIKTAEVVYTSGLTAGANPVVGTFNGEVR
ncbi:hypothetical protein J3L18_29730 [Mucilaginibacter gossypii]|uniref:hypothetical protein n=1 Tax=Mucilaginibacter gossypii TaxID=551996 RepID=UPI000DCE39AE|nr:MULTISPECIES: hypothetical protein [Mucilaginibacter]QTE37239.1 hypothetical protein J3L18_29730 [Mucilaginibacter gossypii]RAV57200.1 hypothetical protein DIU36_12810 [Mucilaginibacter rubeus]